MEPGDYGPVIGILDLDLKDVTIDGAVVNGAATIEATDLAVNDNHFESTSSFVQTGTVINNSGGNVFEGDVWFEKNTGSGGFRFGHTNTDTAYANVHVKNVKRCSSIRV